MDLGKAEKEEKAGAAVVVPAVGTRGWGLALASTNTIIRKQTCWFFLFVAFAK